MLELPLRSGGQSFLLSFLQISSSFNDWVENNKTQPAHIKGKNRQKHTIHHGTVVLDRIICSDVTSNLIFLKWLTTYFGL